MKIGDLVRLKHSKHWTGIVISFLHWPSPALRRAEEDKALFYYTNGTKGEPWIKDLEVISEAK